MLSPCVALILGWGGPSGTSKVVRDVGRVVSPDKAYVAKAEIREGSCPYLFVHRGSQPLLEVTDAQGFGWLTGRPGTLVYGVSGIYGDGGLFVWDPKRGKAPLVPVRQPTDVVFQLLAVRRKGETYIVDYRRGGVDEIERDYRPRTLTFRLGELRFGKPQQRG